jgi:hypothetical protein
MHVNNERLQTMDRDILFYPGKGFSASSKEFNGSSRAWETSICVKKGEILT